MKKTVVHVVGTGTIGEPLIGLFTELDGACVKVARMGFTDPVYEGKSMAGLIDLVRNGSIKPGSRVLYAHLGGQPALNGYAGAF